jgi:hypothetical protein
MGSAALASPAGPVHLAGGESRIRGRSSIDIYMSIELRPLIWTTLALPDVYAVIAYYLRHRGEVEGYLAQREQKAEEVWQRLESQQGDLSEIRARLRAERQP